MGRPKGSVKKNNLEIPEPIENVKVASEAMETETQPAAFVERESGEAATKRISFKVTPKGTIEFEGMRDATRKDLKSVIAATAKEADGAKNLGLKAEEIPLVVPPEFCKGLYDAIGKLESVIAQRGMGIEQDIADGIFKYSEEEKNLLAMPTALVISKYSPETVGKYKEEIQLAVLLGGLTFSKFAQAKQMQAHRDALKNTRTGAQQ